MLSLHHPSTLSDCLLCGDVDTGLSKEDCAAILQQNGYSPIETLVPAKKLFTLFSLGPDISSHNTLSFFREGLQIASVRRDEGGLLVRQVLATPRPEGSDSQRIELLYRREMTPKGRRHDCTACLILCEGSKSRGYTASLKTIPWAPSFTKKIHRLVARFEKAERSPNKPLYLEARYDDLLPPPARKQDWFRKLPKARL